MGAIFRARDTELDETVALKFLTGGSTPSSPPASCGIKSARVNHPNVVRVFTLERWEDRRFIVMEYIDGISLPRWMARGPAPTLVDRRKLATQLATALEAAHQVGVVHRDIKPENILVTAAGEPKILDFGIARPESHGNTLTATGAVFGSPMYMSPEQIQSQGVDRRTDVYSLGAVLYFLFTGVEPFAGRDIREILTKHLAARPPAPRSLDPSLPRALSDAIMMALAADASSASRRPPTSRLTCR
jgi:serine/threonine protein kinase